MANIKVSELPTTSNINNEDYLMVVQSNTSKKITRENLIKNIKDGITLGLAENTAISISTAYATVKIPLDTTKAQRNNNSTFTVQSNGIKINKSGYYVINANIMSNSADTSQTIIGTMYRIRNNANSYLADGYALVTRTGYYTIGLTSFITYLNENDIICIGISGSKTGDITVAGGRFTYLTVMEL